MPSLPMPFLHESLVPTTDGRLLSPKHPRIRTDPRQPGLRLLAWMGAGVPLALGTTAAAFAVVDENWAVAGGLAVGGTLATVVLSVAIQQSRLVRGGHALVVTTSGIQYGPRSWPWSEVRSARVDVVDALAIEDRVPVPAFVFDSVAGVEAFRLASAEEAQRVVDAVDAVRR